MNEDVDEAYRVLRSHAMTHDTDNGRNIGALLLNSFNYNIPGTGFSTGQFGNLDPENKSAVLCYLEWIGSASGWYPPSQDMDALKAEWVARGWLTVPGDDE